MLAPLRGNFCMRTLTAGFVLAALLLAAPAMSAPQVNAQGARAIDPAADSAALEARLDAIINRVGKDGAKACAKARPDLIAYVRSAAFPRLSDRTRRAALMLVIACTTNQNDGQALYAARLLEPIATESADRGLANFQLMLDEEERDPLAAARRLNVVLETFPELVADWESAWFESMLKAARSDGALELSLLSKLVTVDWTDETSLEASSVWWRMDLARRQTKLNNLIALRATLKPVDDPGSLISIAQDRRFEALWPEMEAAGRFDWLAVAEADLARKRKAVADKPRSLAHIRQLMQSLRELGRYDEAIAVGQAARDRLSDTKAFDDQDTETHWTLNDLAYAYSGARRAAEADAVFREALAAGARAGDRVSQPVNFSEELIRRGRHQEALTLVQAVADKDSSPIGITWRDASIVCAQAPLDRAKANALADDLLKRWEINPQAASHALLCLDRIDDAAALMVKRLGSDDHRVEALYAALIGRRPPGSDSPWDQRMQANRDAVWARPEVMKALAPVGRRIEVPYYGSYWGAE